jgi:Leucine-rich repeat (LRR) protein
MKGKTMKRLLAILLITAIFTGCNSKPEETEEVPIPTSVIIADEEFPFSTTRLSLREKNLTNTDILPLRYLTAMNNLELRFNDISDISPIAGLIGLTRLDLSFNEISNINAIANLTNLTYLDLRHNFISDVSALGDLTELRELDLGSNAILDGRPLMRLKDLEILIINDNPIGAYGNETLKAELEAALPNTIIHF